MGIFLSGSCAAEEITRMAHRGTISVSCQGENWMRAHTHFMAGLGRTKATQQVICSCPRPTPRLPSPFPSLPFPSLPFPNVQLRKQAKPRRFDSIRCGLFSVGFAWPQKKKKGKKKEIWGETSQALGIISLPPAPHVPTTCGHSISRRG